MNEENKSYAGYWIRRFLCEYLTNIRNLSANTLKSYRDAIRLLMPFVAKCVKKEVDKILLTDITDVKVADFLESLERNRSCSIKTRNLRLAAICSLAKYVSINSPEHIEWSRNIRNIPVKKTGRTLITYLEKEEMNALLDAPDKKTSQGWRDYALLLFLYNTGVRVDEAATLLIRDLSLPKRKGLAVVSITGKGNKTRRCPLWQHTSDALSSIIRNRAEDEHVFLNRLGQPITRFGIYEMVTRYAEKIEDRMPTIKKKRVSPHTIRHTTATHLLQSGVDINTIRAWLGHVSINTTNIYADVNMEMKAKALSNCEIEKKHKVKSHWKDDKKLMDFLDSL